MWMKLWEHCGHCKVCQTSPPTFFQPHPVPGYWPADIWVLTGRALPAAFPALTWVPGTGGNNVVPSRKAPWVLLDTVPKALGPC